MKTQRKFSVKLIATAMLLALVTMVPFTLAASGSLPAGSYSTTVTLADIPPDFPPEFAEILVGTWVTTFDGNREYTVTKNGDFVAHGTYTSNKSHLVMYDKDGPLACTDEHGIATGIYTFVISNNELTVTPVLDRCYGRQFVLTLRPMQQL